MLEQHIMQEARRALLYANMTITEVAFSLGFTDVGYFSRFFSRRAGALITRIQATQVGI